MSGLRKCPKCGHEIGLTAQVRKLAKRGLTAKEIVAKLEPKGWFKGYRSNPLISVHTIMGRIKDQKKEAGK